MCFWLCPNYRCNSLNKFVWTWSDSLAEPSNLNSKYSKFALASLSENLTCADQESVCQRGSNADNVCFLVDEGRDDPNKSEPSSACQQNAI